MLYHRDKKTGDHIVVVDGCERRYPTRAAAMAACKERIGQPDEGGATR